VVNIWCGWASSSAQYPVGWLVPSLKVQLFAAETTISTEVIAISFPNSDLRQRLRVETNAHSGTRLAKVPSQYTNGSPDSPKWASVIRPTKIECVPTSRRSSTRQSTGHRL